MDKETDGRAILPESLVNLRVHTIPMALMTHR
jgi:hypothetical protein